MIRGINKENIIMDFLLDTNSVVYAREYGITEVIDGFLYYTYEGSFNDDEIEEIIELLNKEVL